MKRISLLVCLLLFPVISLPADNTPEKLPLPAGPLPARAPTRASWKIIVTYSAPAAGPAGKVDARPPSTVLKERSVSKSDRTYQRTDIFNDGSLMKWWWIDGTVMSSAGNGPYIISDYKDTGPFSYQNSDFPELTWIGPSCYARVEVVGGVTCFVFEKLRPRASDVDMQEMSATDQDAAQQDVVQTTAWISVETHLPVKQSIPGQSEVYTFLSLPTEGLVLPAKAAQQFALHEARDEQLTRRGPPP